MSIQVTSIMNNKKIISFYPFVTIPTFVIFWYIIKKFNQYISICIAIINIIINLVLIDTILYNLK